MPRGFSWCLYVDDDGNNWALRVDADEALDPGRGWQSLGGPTLAPLPRGWIPRAVAGADSLGYRRQTRVGSTSAPLWLGTETTFYIEGSDLIQIPVTVTERLAERRR